MERKRVLCNVMESHWSVNFTDGEGGIGPWVLSDPDGVLEILRWGHATAQAIADHERDIRRWGTSGTELWLEPAQLESLRARARGWPWNGYELAKMREAGKYPPQRMSDEQTHQFLTSGRKQRVG